MFVASIESKDGGYISYSIKLEKKGLAIAATDGQDAFYKLISAEASQSYKMKHIKTSGDEWFKLFQAVLAREADESLIVQASRSGDLILFNLLNTNSGTRLKMASFEVGKSDALIDLQEWLSFATRQQDAMRSELTEKAERIRDLEKALEDARQDAATQMDEFKEHEDQTLKRMCLLLNAKKDKIRELNGHAPKRVKVEERSVAEQDTTAVNEDMDTAEERSDAVDDDDDATTDDGDSI